MFVFTPAIKGLITKALKNTTGVDVIRTVCVRKLLERYMPREQAKHAARRYLAQL